MFEFLKKIFSSKKEPDSGMPMKKQSMPVVSYGSETQKQNPPAAQNISMTGSSYPQNSSANAATNPKRYDGTGSMQNRDVMDDLEAARKALRDLHEMNEKWKRELEETGNGSVSEESNKRNLLEEYFKGDLEGIVLTDEFRQTFDRMENSSDSLIITGKAGTGKSTLLKYFLVHTKKSSVALAPTGIAAINIGGDTIHKFFRFPPHLLTPDDINIRPNKLYESIDTLIIDEFSMVNANLLDAVDEMLRGNGKKPFAPFGGVQVIFFGDFFQIPPVVSSQAERAYFANEYNNNPWFFGSKVFQRDDFSYKIIELQENHRQNEQQFMDLLDNMRLGRQTQEQLDLLNSRFGADNHDVSEFPIMLVPTNRKSDDYNAYKLDELDIKEYVFEGKCEGEFPKERFPTLPQLHLKVGAQVMTIVNKTGEGYVNGTIGKVISISDDLIQIEVDSREGRHTCDVCRHTWENFRYHYVREEHRVAREKIGTFTQFPLKLAWSITVHKSQGLTFVAVTLDIGGNAFAPGLAYVAVSRCRSLEGLRLHSRIRMTDVKVDPHARQFYLENSIIDKSQK